MGGKTWRDILYLDRADLLYARCGGSGGGVEEAIHEYTQCLNACMTPEVLESFFPKMVCCCKCCEC